jgi:hypothetical protein
MIHGTGSTSMIQFHTRRPQCAGAGIFHRGEHRAVTPQPIRMGISRAKLAKGAKVKKELTRAGEAAHLACLARETLVFDAMLKARRDLREPRKFSSIVIKITEISVETFFTRHPRPVRKSVEGASAVSFSPMRLHVR